MSRLARYLQPVQDALMRRSRRRKLNHFFSLCRPGQTVLDVGVSGVVDDGRWPMLNFFLKNYAFAPETYTGIGIDDMTKVQAKYPRMKFVRYDGTVFPFADKTFDWAFSNAVIEHVGDEAQQLLFVNEMLRVARSVYFTTPNMYFPVELHTHQLLRHWNRERFQRWLVEHHPYVAEKDRLRLLGFRDLVGLMQRSTACRFRIVKNRLLGWPMTFSVIADANG